jgi:outer membrane protein assembly factor BamE (lipoprotein component of BamABCDE complex)
MNTGLRLLLLAAIAAGIAGCSTLAMQRLVPGTSTEADVMSAMGKPDKVYANPDGSRVLAYPGGSEGTQAYMVAISKDGRLERLDQVLTPERIARIVPGQTTQSELERLIGPPWRTMNFERKRQVAWDYTIQDTWGYTVDFSVMLDERGIVVETVHARRSRGDNLH